MNDISEKLKEIYASTVPAEVEKENVPDINLIETLNIDSILSLEILISVEDAFQITIDDEDLSPELIDSIITLSTYVSKRLDEK